MGRFMLENNLSARGGDVSSSQDDMVIASSPVSSAVMLGHSRSHSSDFNNSKYKSFDHFNISRTRNNNQKFGSWSSERTGGDVSIIVKDISVPKDEASSRSDSAVSLDRGLDEFKQYTTGTSKIGYSTDDLDSICSKDDLNYDSTVKSLDNLTSDDECVQTDSPFEISVIDLNSEENDKDFCSEKSVKNQINKNSIINGSNNISNSKLNINLKDCNSLGKVVKENIENSSITNSESHLNNISDSVLPPPPPLVCNTEPVVEVSSEKVAKVSEKETKVSSGDLVDWASALGIKAADLAELSELADVTNRTAKLASENLFFRRNLAPR